MTKRLEAAFDPGGLALGVQVYAAAECRDDPRYLLALLNSKLFSYLFRTRFRAKELAGGFLAINKGQLAQLPVRVIDEANPDEIHLRTQLIKQVEVLLAAPFAKAAIDPLAERRIDELVYRLYRLTAAEIDRVEAEFQAPSTRRKAA
jgi:adenine-specific DNA-methyltransferase